MTLEEAIKRYTDNAEYERTHVNLQGCLDFRQLAEWLKELKRLRVPKKMGRWLNVTVLPDDQNGHAHGECSVCGKVRIVDNYCPNCGAKMEESED